MITARLFRIVGEPIGEAWQRPLSLSECLHAASVLFIVGTAYCQFYCFIAYPSMDGMAMPLSLSMWRSAVETLPAILALEVSKRVLRHGADCLAIVGVALAILLAAAISVTMALVLRNLFHASAMPLRPVLADRLPGITLTAIAIAWATRQARTANSANAASPAGALPPVKWIDWIRAAGNYVEIRVAGRSLLRRMTMAQAEQLLGGSMLIRVHRSMLINRGRIVALDHIDRPRRVHLTDGTVVKVGEAYRANLA